jgi:DNA-binding response OmpR family regulator
MTSRILLVEDDERIRASMRLSLEDEGYEIDESESGEDALEAHARSLVGSVYDLIVVDIMLPGMDGMEFCRELRKSSTVPIIIVTALDDPAHVVSGLEAGADDYVRKPVEPSELRASGHCCAGRGRRTVGRPRSCSATSRSSPKRESCAAGGRRST